MTLHFLALKISQHVTWILCNQRVNIYKLLTSTNFYTSFHSDIDRENQLKVRISDLHRWTIIHDFSRDFYAIEFGLLKQIDELLSSSEKSEKKLFWRLVLPCILKESTSRLFRIERPWTWNKMTIALHWSEFRQAINHSVHAWFHDFRRDVCLHTSKLIWELFKTPNLLHNHHVK